MRIPLYIEFQGKRVAVIGGGGVGTVRAKKFVEVGAEVTVFSRDFTDELKIMSLDGKVRLVETSVEDLDFEDLAKRFELIVVAIGSREFNEKIIEAAKKHRAMVNLANDAQKTEVVVPFEGGRDGIRFAVTTEGKSGVVARKVRDEFQRVLEEKEELISFLKAMDYLKSYMKSNNVPVSLRMKIYPAVSSDSRFLELVNSGRLEEAKKLIEEVVAEYVSGKREVENGGIQFDR